MYMYTVIQHMYTVIQTIILTQTDIIAICGTPFKLLVRSIIKFCTHVFIYLKDRAVYAQVMKGQARKPVAMQGKVTCCEGLAALFAMPQSSLVHSVMHT